MFINTGWFYKIWYIHTMEYEAAVKKNMDSVWDDKKVLEMDSGDNCTIT